MSAVTALLTGAAAPAVLVAARRPAGLSVGFSPAGGGCSLAVECSSRPQKKATKHHMKTRPKKTQPWDIKRRPTQYPPLPPLRPDWTPQEDDEAEPAAAAVVEVVAAPAEAD